MVVLNAALLSLLLPAVVLARPNQHEKLHHKRHNHDYKPPSLSEVHPCGIHGGPPDLCHPSESGNAPYPTGNQTQPGPTGTGLSASSATVTISSVITVVPLPVTSPNNEGSPTGAPGGSGQSGSPGGPGGHGAPGGPGNSEVCGPATVTVTSAKTITVTVPGAGSQQSSSPPAGPPAAAEQPTPQIKPQEKEQKPQEQTTPKPQKPENKPAPEGNASPVKQTQPPSEAKPQTEENKKELSQQPKPQPQPKVEASKPETEEKEKQPQGQHTQQQPQQPQAPQPKSSSAPESSPSEAPKKSPSGGKKGILYRDVASADAMAGHVSWGCNWDSSPIPAVGRALGELAGLEFVPQLWGPQDVHTSVWSGNSQGAPYVMGFNEPNQPQGNGGCGPMDANSAVAPYEANMKPNKEAGQKIVSPCVSNDASEWLDTFISATSLKPDAVCFHWYGLSLEELQGVVKDFAGIQSKHGIPELWMSEFALNTDISTSDMEQLLEWLGNESGVDRFAYNNEKLSGTPQIKQAYCGSS